MGYEFLTIKTTKKNASEEFLEINPEIRQELPCAHYLHLFLGELKGAFQGEGDGSKTRINLTK